MNIVDRIIANKTAQIIWDYIVGFFYFFYKILSYLIMYYSYLIIALFQIHIDQRPGAIEPMSLKPGHRENFKKAMGIVLLIIYGLTGLILIGGLIISFFLYLFD
tara:strand:- start:1243 stop:1554 length:312 start_codon:yes stop_codon:yes gene_type:complete